MFEMFELDFSLAAAVMVLIIIDIITGLVYAFASGTFSSSIMRDGIFKKFGTVAVLFLAAFLTVMCQVSGYFPAEFSMIYPPVCLLLIAMEVASILENIVKINPDLKNNKLFEIFGYSKDDEEDDEKEGENA